MTTFEGTRELPKSITIVFASLGDAGFLSGCVGPLLTCDATPDLAQWTMKPSIGIVTGNLACTLAIVDRVAEERVRIDHKIHGAGFKARAEITASLRETNGGTTVTWRADLAERTGLLRMVPESMLRAAGEKAADELWREVEAKLP